METNELLPRILDKLHIPRADGSIHTSDSVRAPQGGKWRDLRKAIRDLEESASRVGELPTNYPLHLKPVMRVIHALLPWYTRPLRQHAENTVSVAHALRAVLEEIEARTPLSGRSDDEAPR